MKTIFIIVGVLYIASLIGCRKAYLKRRREINRER